ncbi:kinesin-like protein KIN-12B [Fagus crenata]
MKHFMQPWNAILREAHSTNPSSSLSPSLAKPRPYRNAKSEKENAPPSDPNSMAYDSMTIKYECGDYTHPLCLLL